MSRTTSSPPWKLPGATTLPTFGACRATVTDSPDGGAGDFARVRVHARGQVDREHRRLGRVHLRDDLGGVRPRLAMEPRAEEPVDDDVAVEPLVCLAARRAQRLERDPRVAAVRAASAYGAERPRVRESGAAPPPPPRAPPAPSARGRRAPPPRARISSAVYSGSMHQLASDAMAMAAASSFECVIERSTSPTPSRARPLLEPPVKAHGRLRPAGDLDLPPREAPRHAEPERLADGLLAGEPRGVVLRRVRPRVAVRALGLREAARGERRVAGPSPAGCVRSRSGRCRRSILKVLAPASPEARRAS